MKFKRIVTCLLALCALLSCCSFSGCIITHEIVEQIETVPWFDYDEERTLSDYIPEEYGEWDGNYIYSGNMRSKTTGEALEKLVEEITIGEETYAVSVWSPYYIDDNMFAMASFTVEEKTHNCLIKYNIKDKTTEILYYSLEKPLKGFYYMRSDRIILKVIEDETVKLITLDMQGNVVEEDSSYYLEYKPYSDYLMREEGNTLYLRKWDDELEYCLGTYNPRYEIKIRTIDGAKGIQIKHYQKKNSQGLYVVGWEEVYYFDLETCTLSKLLGFEEERYYNDQRLNAAYYRKGYRL